MTALSVTRLPIAAVVVGLAGAGLGCNQDAGSAAAPGGAGAAGVEAGGGDAPGGAGDGGGVGDAAGDEAGDAAGDEAGDAAGDGEGDGAGGPGGDGSRPAAYGEPCRANGDCDGGYCIASPRGFVCTSACGSEDDCPPLAGVAMGCRDVDNTGADAVAICVPAASAYCQPCYEDAHCFGGACVPSPAGGQAGRFCGQDCGSEGGGCPDGSVCSELAPDGSALARPQCLPATLACDCTADRAGERRPCVRTSVDGKRRCFGEETCVPDRGWVGCDARLPDREVCDGADNDCNGAIDDGLPAARPCAIETADGACSGLEVCAGVEGWTCLAARPAPDVCDLADNDCDGVADEDFRDAEGRYVRVDHCGVCGNDCRERFDLAAAAECQVIEGQARCVITACREGYALAGPTACIPLASRLCEPCAADADCNEDVGDACIPYGEGPAFCGRSCADDSPFGPDCPPGYGCDPDLLQCRLRGGTCLCGPDDRFERACAVADPAEPGRHCVGVVRCEAGELSECVPPEDRCNGVDDDCDGVIDQGMRDPQSGHWFTDAHCGRCHNDCVALFADPVFHGDGFCTGLEDARRGRRPACRLRCRDGWRDVNGVSVDGCECPVLDPDADEPDPLGVDANCDGIDGVIGRGIFVARTGDDAGDGTLARPLRTISAALALAVPGGRDQVYVSAGVYDESITLRAGVSLFGGYGPDFRVRDPAGNETAIFGRAPADGLRGAVNAAGIAGARTVLSSFTIAGYDVNAESASSYVLHLVDCDGALEVRDCVIRAGGGGHGGKGRVGAAGVDAPDTATAGAVERASGTGLECTPNPANRSAGGVGAVHQCAVEGGGQMDSSGGTGGTADCPVFNQAEPAGTAGRTAPQAGAGGAGGYNMLLTEDGAGNCFCTIPNVPGSTEDGLPGGDGRDGAPGAPGVGCDGGAGHVVDGGWVAGERALAGRGGDGRRGGPGGGGGGGGAGSGAERNWDLFWCGGFAEVLGGGGGGGGAGGCGGAGGVGGRPGGGSFGAFMTWTRPPASLPILAGNRIERGTGGTGGDGGEGGEGGDGSTGREGRSLAMAQRQGLLVCADPGGRGGDGGAGGPGGGGGGGCGGIAAGIYLHNHGRLATDALRAANVFPATGAGGLAGRGGVSLGEDGGGGAAGSYVEVSP